MGRDQRSLVVVAVVVAYEWRERERERGPGWEGVHLVTFRDLLCILPLFFLLSGFFS